MEVLRNFSNVVSTFAENGRSKVKVWLDSQNLKTVYHKKMRPKREGPFPITKVLGPVTYRLQLPATWRIHIVFHAALLRPYKENEVYGENYTEPPPELVEGVEVYEMGIVGNMVVQAFSGDMLVLGKGSFSEFIGCSADGWPMGGSLVDGMVLCFNLMYVSILLFRSGSRRLVGFFWLKALSVDNVLG